MEKTKIFVSGCLGGAKIRYNGSGVDIDDAIWKRWESQSRLFHFCPELAAGFGVPRPAAEIVGGSAIDVINKSAKVYENTGSDVTSLFITGAKLAVKAAIERRVSVAIMTDGSPSCGSTYIDAGNFDGTSKEGRGVVTQMLIDAGIKVFAHTQLKEADAYIRKLEDGTD